MIPEYWINFIKDNDIVGVDFELPEESDLSGLGIDMKIMSVEQCVSEAKECYPGIVAIKEDYIPVGMCMSGSGDYYYIRGRDGEYGALYRVYHDAVKNDRLQDGGVDRVLDSYVSILSFAQK